MRFGRRRFRSFRRNPMRRRRVGGRRRMRLGLRRIGYRM